MSNTIQLGISTCPNDTFAFHAILNRRIDLHGLQFETQLLDIQELNQGILSGQFDVAKASFALALHVADTWAVLPSGSALGFGVGPLLLAAESGQTPGDESQTTLCPGEHTTANLLFKMFWGQTRVKQILFSEIMSALQRRDADFGVCIHEGRFTYEQSGLTLVEDLGTRWESETGCPLPLGGILARRELGKDLLGKVQSVIRQSIEYGLQNREETLPTMRRYAQEFADDVLLQHVDLYVNDWTLELGDAGRLALQKISQLGNRMAGNRKAPSKADVEIEIFDPNRF